VSLAPACAACWRSYFYPVCFSSSQHLYFPPTSPWSHCISSYCCLAFIYYKHCFTHHLSINSLLWTVKYSISHGKAQSDDKHSMPTTVSSRQLPYADHLRGAQYIEDCPPQDYWYSEQATNMNFGSSNPYRCNSPESLCRRPSTDSLRSVPSIDFSGTLEHHPVYPKTSWASSRPRPRPRSYPETQRYSPDSGLVNPDVIDRMDNVGDLMYHHEGPYDAVCRERNRKNQMSPLEAVSRSNEEALRATPRERIVDSVRNNRPLDGTAFYPPGITDNGGNTYDYEEGANMMSDFGNFMRDPGFVSSVPLLGILLTNFVCRNSETRTSKTTGSTRIRRPSLTFSWPRCSSAVDSNASPSRRVVQAHVKLTP